MAGETVQVEGFVVRMFEKSGTNSRGAWTAYSIKIADAGGTEDARFFQFGFSKPPFKTDVETNGNGDYVRFQAEVKDEKVAQFVKGSGEIVKNPPARAAKVESRPTGGGRSSAKTKTSELFGDIGGYNTEDDIKRMSLSAARTAAIAAAGLLLQHDGLPMSGGKNKSHVEKRFSEITAVIDKLTVAYFFDSANGRLLDMVADTRGVSQTTVAPLPDDVNGEDLVAANPADEEGGEIPPDPDSSEEQQNLNF